MSAPKNSLARMNKVTDEIRGLRKRVQFEVEQHADENENTKSNFYGQLRQKTNAFRAAVTDLESVVDMWVPASGGGRKTRKAKRKARKTRRR